MFPNVSNRWVYVDNKSARKMCQEKDKNQSFAQHVSLKLLSGIFFYFLESSSVFLSSLKNEEAAEIVKNAPRSLIILFYSIFTFCQAQMVGLLAIKPMNNYTQQ